MPSVGEYRRTKLTPNCWRLSPAAPERAGILDSATPEFKSPSIFSVAQTYVPLHSTAPKGLKFKILTNHKTSPKLPLSWGLKWQHWERSWRFVRKKEKSLPKSMWWEWDAREKHCSWRQKCLLLLLKKTWGHRKLSCSRAEDQCTQLCPTLLGRLSTMRRPEDVRIDFHPRHTVKVIKQKKKTRLLIQSVKRTLRCQIVQGERCLPCMQLTPS